MSKIEAIRGEKYRKSVKDRSMSKEDPKGINVLSKILRRRPENKVIDTTRHDETRENPGGKFIFKKDHIRLAWSNDIRTIAKEKTLDYDGKRHAGKVDEIYEADTVVEQIARISAYEGIPDMIICDIVDKKTLGDSGEFIDNSFRKRYRLDDPKVADVVLNAARELDIEYSNMEKYPDLVSIGLDLGEKRIREVMAGKWPRVKTAKV